MIPDVPRLDAATIWSLLPAHLRARDEEAGGALRALLEIVAEEVEAFERHLDRLYDDQFIETCDPSVVPLIGALVGLRPLESVAADGGEGEPALGGTARAEVANALAARRRKGTAAMLEQVARDASGWPCRLIECFRGLATTQHLNHLRLERPATLNLRHGLPLERLHGPLGAVMRTVDLRTPDSAAPRWGVPHVSVALWPLEAVSVTRVVAVEAGPGLYRFSPLGCDQPLFARPDPESDLLGLAEPRHVPRQISRLELEADLAESSPAQSLYGEGRSIEVWLDGALVPRERVRAVHLGNLGPTDADGWAHQPVDPSDDRVAIDPVLGRLAVRADLAVNEVLVTWHRALPAKLGGGEYAIDSIAPTELQPVEDSGPGRPLDAALDALGLRDPAGGSGVVRVAGTPGQSISTDCTIAADSTVVLCALGAGWPLVDLGGGVSVRFLGDGELLLEGLVVVGGPLRVLDDGTVRRRRLHLRHCTLVPGLRLAPDGAPRHPGEPSLIVDAPGVEVVIEHSIVGGLRLHRDVELRASDSVIDATDAAQPALCAPDGAGPIGPLTLDGCTVIGAVHAALARLISNAILLAETPTGWPAPVVMERRQAGCVRFSWLPVESIVPRRFRCLPSEVAPGEPRHLSLRYGHPGYAMLHPATALAIRRAADDEDEPGAMHQARRQRRLRHAAIRVEEHLRAGFAAGLIEVVPRGTVGLAGDRFSDPTT